MGDAAEALRNSRMRDGAPASGGHFQETACLNCQTALVGPHCHQCGQEAHLHRTVGGFLHDLVHGVLHLEGKTWRTLPELALRPGQLTRRYIEGERKRFVSPMGLFLFSIFLMFAVFQALGISAPADPTINGTLTGQIERARQAAQDDRIAAEAAIRSASPQSEAYREARGDLARAEAELAEIKQARGTIDISMEPDRRGSASTEFGGLSADAVEKWRENPGLMLYKLQSNSYKFSWLLIPLSVPFMWLLFFWKRRFTAYDHAVFVTYSIAFMSLFFIVLSAVIKAGLPDGIFLLGLLSVPPIHIYRQLRGAYGVSRFGAMWRLILVLAFIVIAMALFGYLLVLMGSF